MKTSELYIEFYKDFTKSMLYPIYYYGLMEKVLLLSYLVFIVIVIRLLMVNYQINDFFSLAKFALWAILIQLLFFWFNERFEKKLIFKKKLLNNYGVKVSPRIIQYELFANDIDDSGVSLDSIGKLVEWIENEDKNIFFLIKNIIESKIVLVVITALIFAFFEKFKLYVLEIEVDISLFKLIGNTIIIFLIFISLSILINFFIFGKKEAMSNSLKKYLVDRSKPNTNCNLWVPNFKNSYFMYRSKSD